MFDQLMGKPVPAYPIKFEVEPQFLSALQVLPWQYPIEEWRKHGVRHLDVKRGIGRHPVVFVQTNGFRFVVKELGYEVSKREVENYRQMLLSIGAID